MLKDRFVILIYSALLFIPFIGSVHLFDWDEINFAESAREMLVTGNWWQVQINYVPFREKPPLFFWMQALSMKVFGVNEFAARFPNAICGIVTLQVLYGIGLTFKDRIFAWIWVLVYSGSLLPFLYFKSGIIDPWFNLFIFLSIYHLYLVLEQPSQGIVKHSVFAGLFTGLAILTKGPVGLLLALLTFIVWLLSTKFKKSVPIKGLLTYAGISASVSFIWFGYETFQNGPWFLVEFIEYQIELFKQPVAGHKQPFFYHFVVVLIGCFPASILALPAFSKKFLGDENQFSKWMKYLFWVVMILFSVVSTKIVHYSSMSYLPLTYLASLVALNVYRGNLHLPKWTKIWLGVQGAILGFAIALLPILIYFRASLVPFIKDPFVQGNLSADVSYNGLEWLAGTAIILVIAFALKQLTNAKVKAFKTLTIGMSIALFATLTLVVPLIESISQASLIRFLESHSNKNVEFVPKHFKTYAHYFYGKVNPPNKAGSSSSADSTIYISKVQHISRVLKQNPDCVLLKTEGGFAFYSDSPH